MKHAVIANEDAEDDIINSSPLHPQQHRLGGQMASEDRLPWLAYSALLRIVEDPVLVEYHMPATQCITFIVKELGPRARHLLDSVKDSL